MQLSEDENKDLEMKLIATSARENDLKIGLKHVETELMNAKRDKSECSVKCKGLEKEVATLRDTLQLYQDQKKDLTKEFNACVMKETHLETKLTKVNTRLEAAEDEKKQYLNACEDLKKQKVEFERKLQRLKDEKENILKEVTNLKTDLEHERIELERTERYKKEYIMKCKELEERKEDLERRLQNSEDEKKGLEKKCNDCSTKEKNLEVELKGLTNRLNRAERAKRERIHDSKRCNDLKKQTAEPESKLTQCSEDQTKENTILESPGRGKTASRSRKSGTQGMNNRLFYFKSSILAVTVFIRLKSPTSN